MLNKSQEESLISHCLILSHLFPGAGDNHRAWLQKEKKDWKEGTTQGSKARWFFKMYGANDVSLNCTTMLQHKYHPCAHFTDEETET
jgi:hypothetical protein